MLQTWQKSITYLINCYFHRKKCFFCIQKNSINLFASNLNLKKNLKREASHKVIGIKLCDLLNTKKKTKKLIKVKNLKPAKRFFFSLEHWISTVKWWGYLLTETIHGTQHLLQKPKWKKKLVIILPTKTLIMNYEIDLISGKNTCLLQVKWQNCYVNEKKKFVFNSGFFSLHGMRKTWTKLLRVWNIRFVFGNCQSLYLFLNEFDVLITEAFKWIETPVTNVRNTENYYYILSEDCIQ